MTTTLVPWPNLLEISILPLWASTTALHRLSPSPKPPVLREREESLFERRDRRRAARPTRRCRHPDHPQLCGGGSFPGSWKRPPVFHKRCGVSGCDVRAAAINNDTSCLFFCPIYRATSTSTYPDIRRRMCLVDEPKSCAILCNYFSPRP